jgi:hypothetical protein
MALTSTQVLHQHVLLTERMKRPDAVVANFLRFHMAGVISDNGRASAMFHPVLRAGYKGIVTDDDAKAMCRILGASLAAATTFHVADHMVASMRTIFESTWRGPEVIHGAEMPCTSGFAWLDTPWLLGEPGSRFFVRAVSWQFTEVFTVPDLMQAGHTSGGDAPWPCVRVGLWRYQGDETDPREHYSRVLGSLLITHTALVPLDLGFAKDQDGEALSSEAFLALVHLLWMFLGMEITASERQPIKATNLKRAARVLHHPEVRVVLLRRVRHASDPSGTSREVDWTCRWIVQGHYRHKERPEKPHRAIAAGADKHCVVCGAELQNWIAPYIKGPDGLPLRATEQTVMRLAR